MITDQKFEVMKEVAYALKRTYNNNFLMPDLVDLIIPSKNCDMEEIKKYWRQQIGRIKDGKARNHVNFYLNIPYCKSKCNYCMYSSKAIESSDEISLYLYDLIEVMKSLKGIFEGTKFKTLYIGGGTPSILTSKQIEFLLDNLFKNFKFEDEGERSFECNPDSVTLQKLKILRKYSINSISFGVQSMDRNVLESENRGYQSSEQVKKVVSYAKKLGFKRVNVDLICGLKSDSIDILSKSLSELMKLEPTSICIYPLQPTKKYLKEYYNDDLNYFDKEIIAQLNSLSKELNVPNGYIVHEPDLANMRTASPWYLQAKELPSLKYEYSYDSSKETNCFGLGIGACSYIHNKIRYQYDDIDNVTAIILTSRLQKIRYILNEFSYSKEMSLSDYRRLFSSELAVDFKEGLAELTQQKMLKLENGNLIFLPEDTIARFVYSMFFFDFHDVVRKYLELGSGNVETQYIVLGHKCNNHCISCQDDINEDNESVKSQVEMLKKDPKEILLTGGEPTLYLKNLVKLVRFLSEKDYIVGIVTNGRAFSDKEIVKILVKSGLKKAIVTIHGNEDIHDQITQVDGSYSQTIKGIKNLIDNDVETRVNYVCVKDNMKYLLPTMKFLNDLGIKKFIIQKFVTRGRALKNYENLKFTPEYFEKYLEKLVMYIQNSDIEVKFEFFCSDFFQGKYARYAPTLKSAINDAIYHNRIDRD